MTAKSRQRKIQKKSNVHPLPHLAIGQVEDENGLIRYNRETCTCMIAANHFKKENS